MGELACECFEGGAQLSGVDSAEAVEELAEVVDGGVQLPLSRCGLLATQQELSRTLAGLHLPEDGLGDDLATRVDGLVGGVPLSMCICA